LTTDKQNVFSPQTKVITAKIIARCPYAKLKSFSGSKNTLDSQAVLSVANSHERVGNTFPELALSFSC
ncbi:MAG: hypothetical protein ACKO9A_13435, partial [Alphaproteobacteria bacterium]